MTCIVAMVQDGKIFMGGDAGAFDSSIGMIQAVNRPKVFAKSGVYGKFILGYTSSFRMGQILEQYFHIPKPEKSSEYGHLIKDIIPHIKEILQEHNYTEVENNLERGGFFLFGYKKHLYQVNDDFSVLEFTDGYTAIGAGRQYALGAMHASEHLEPLDRIRLALNAAAHFSAAVCEPFTRLEL